MIRINPKTLQRNEATPHSRQESDPAKAGDGWHPCELHPRVGFCGANMARQAENVIAIYDKRGRRQQWIEKAKGAIQSTRLSRRCFAANAIRLQPLAAAYNLSNFRCALATPGPIKDWPLTSLEEKPIKIGAKVVSGAMSS
jgi:hypothetical protein